MRRTLFCAGAVAVASTLGEDFAVAVGLAVWKSFGEPECLAVDVAEHEPKRKPEPKKRGRPPRPREPEPAPIPSSPVQEEARNPLDLHALMEPLVAHYIQTSQARRESAKRQHYDGLFQNMMRRGR